MGLIKKVKCILVPKNAGNILGSSGSFHVRLPLTCSLDSPLLQGKSKLESGKSVPFSQTTSKYQMNGNHPSVMMRMLYVSLLKAEYIKDFRSGSWIPVVGIHVQFNITCVDGSQAIIIK